MPCVHSRSSSSWTPCPPCSAWRAATCGQMITSPRVPGSEGRSGPPGRSSSMGKDMTSVGPGRSIQRMCSSAIGSSSTRTTESSASGWIRSASRTYLASSDRADSSTGTPDSFATSMLIALVRPSSSFRTLGAAPRTLFPDVVPAVGVHDRAHQLVPDDVFTGQLGEPDVVDAGEDLLDRAQPAGGAAGQVHLGDITGHHDLGAEAQPGEEHLHLLGRGVLRLVQDDEGVV